MANEKAWDRLLREIEESLKAGLVLNCWWRDDDAIEPSPALQRLGSYGAPIVLAIIPALVREGFSLPDIIRVAQHGYDHKNRALEGEKKSEFPLGRPAGEVIETLRRGRERLENFFPSSFLPLFVPPWNRFAHAEETWRTAGLKKISTYRNYGKEQVSGKASSGTDAQHLDTHIDLIDWRNRSFLGEEAVLEGVHAHWQAKREGRAPKAEPTGFLTHHLVHDSATWSFLDKWTKFLENNKNSIGWILPKVF